MHDLDRRMTLVDGISNDPAVLHGQHVVAASRTPQAWSGGRS
jgi:hypothetical protein